MKAPIFRNVCSIGSYRPSAGTLIVSGTEESILHAKMKKILPFLSNEWQTAKNIRETMGSNENPGMFYRALRQAVKYRHAEACERSTNGNLGGLRTHFRLPQDMVQ